jgi:hypothetical protein
VPHCLDAVEEQVDQHLLNLDAIRPNHRNSVLLLAQNDDAGGPRIVGDQSDCLVDQFRQVDRLRCCRSLAYQASHPCDDIGCAAAVRDDPVERLLGLTHVWFIAAQPSFARIPVCDDRGERLAHLMCNGGGELPKHRDAIRMGQVSRGLFELGSCFLPFSFVKRHQQHARPGVAVPDDGNPQYNINATPF